MCYLDLRETLGHVAVRCLNHKLKGVEAIYNKHDYDDEVRMQLKI